MLGAPTYVGNQLLHFEQISMVINEGHAEKSRR